jgi:hypothetical protein
VSGFSLSGNNTTSVVLNSYMGNNTGYGFNTSSLNFMLLGCAFHNNSSGHTNSATIQNINPVVASGDPLVSANIGDFRLDSTTNEGMLLRGTADSLTPVAFDYTGYSFVPTGYMDIGAFQHKEPTDNELAEAIWSYVTRETTA